MAASQDNMAQAIGGMASVGNPRVPMDTAAAQGINNASADYTSGATLHPRYSQPAMDPAFFPTARPSQTLASGTGGARYRLVVGIPTLSMPEAGPTTANGRVIRSAGTTGSFSDA